MYSRALRRAACDAFQRAARDGEERKVSRKREGGNVGGQRSVLDRSQLRAITSGASWNGVYPDRFARPFNWSFNRPPLLIYPLLQINQAARRTLTQLHIVRHQIRIYGEPANFRLLNFIRLL